MKVSLVDRINFDDAAGMRSTPDGYLVANPRVARTGIQLYRGSEIGGRFKDQRVVRVYRSPDEVFNKDSLHSYAYKPLTNDHPPVPVTADNWKDYSVGQIGGDIVRDGDCVRVPMVFMDAQAIRDIKGGKKQLSVGYGCDIKDEAGTSPEGEAFDCSQSNIFVNHTAVVKAARGGDRLSVGDANLMPALSCDGAAIVSAATLIAAGKVAKEEMANATLFLAPGFPIGTADCLSVTLLEKTRDAATSSNEDAILDAAIALLSKLPTQTTEHTMPKIVVIDGVSVEFATDQSAQIAERAIANRDAALKTATDGFAEEMEKKKKKEAEDAVSITKLTTQNDTLTAENATLKQQVKDAELTPAKLDELVKDREQVVGKAKVVMGDAITIDGKTIGEIKRQVVDKRLGDKAKGWSDEQVSISFDTLTADVKAGDSTAVRDARQAFSQPGFHGASPQNDTRQALYDKRDAKMQDAWKGPQAAA